MNTDNPAAGERTESPEPDEPGSDQPPGRAHAAPQCTIDSADPSLGDAVLRRLRARAPEAAAAALHRAGASPDPAHDIRVRIVPDNEMAALHQRHTGEPGPTDVLTFDMRDEPGAGPLDVDIVVCSGEARRQAEARGLPLERELLLYIVHGLLHCLGHDDHDDNAHRRMHQLEDEILCEIGVGAAYAPPQETRA